MFGLSKNERPILDHHAKAHNFEIQQISCEILGHSPHPAFIKLKSFCCYKVLGGFHMKSGWNPLDFTGEICQISWVKSTRFHEILGHSPPLHSSNWRVFAVIRFWVDFTWNLGEICQISQVKSAGFHGWNPDFMWNPPDFEGPIARNGKPYVLLISKSPSYNMINICVLSVDRTSQKMTSSTRLLNY